MNKITKEKDFEKDFELPKVNEVTFEKKDAHNINDIMRTVCFLLFCCLIVICSFTFLFNELYPYGRDDDLKIHERNEIVNFILESPTRKNVSEYLDKKDYYSKKKYYKEVLDNLNPYLFNELLEGKFKFKNKINSYQESLSQLKNKFINFEINENEYYQLIVLLKNKDVYFKNNSKYIDFKKSLKDIFSDQKITIDEYSDFQLKHINIILDDYKGHDFLNYRLHRSLRTKYSYPDDDINYLGFQKIKDEFKNELKNF